MTDAKYGYSKWRAKAFCTSCEKPMTYSVKMDSHGVCPYCGANDHSTVVDTVTRSYRCRYTEPLTIRQWLFGGRPCVFEFKEKS